MKVKDLENIKQTQEGLCKLAALLGYKDPFYQLQNNDGTVVGDLLEFLDDNPGACEAVIEWVRDNSTAFGIKDDDEEDDEEYEEEGDDD